MKLGLRELVFVLLLAVIPLGAWWLVFRPQNARDADVMRQTEAKRAKLADLNQTTGLIGDMTREIQSPNASVNSLQAKPPTEKELDKVPDEVKRLASSNKLNVKMVRGLDKETEPTYTPADSPHAEQPVRLKVEGDFKGFYAFLLAMESRDRIMRIRKINLIRPDKAAEGTIVATFEMTVFYEKVKDAPCPTKT